MPNKYKGYSASYTVDPSTLRESLDNWIVDVKVEIVTPEGTTALFTFSVFANSIQDDIRERIKNEIDRLVGLADIRESLSGERVQVYGTAG